MRTYEDKPTKPTTERVLTKVTCNGCGLEVGPEPSYAAHVSYDGGYGSTVLRDTTLYEFDLCEGCLARTMGCLKVPPTVRGITVMGDWDGTESSWEEDRRQHEEQQGSERKRLVVQRFHDEAGLCASQDEWNSPPCGHPVVMSVRDGTHEYRYCQRHGNNSYYYWRGTISRPGEPDSTYAERRSVGLMVTRGGPRLDTVIPRTNTHVVLSTLLAMLGHAESRAFALRELARRWSPPPHSEHWVHARVRSMFPEVTPSKSAVLVNAWLTWGQEQGYREAVATAFMGIPPEELWKE